jgi:hypothetical protein
VKGYIALYNRMVLLLKHPQMLLRHVSWNFRAPSAMWLNNAVHLMTKGFTEVLGVTHACMPT